MRNLTMYRGAKKITYKTSDTRPTKNDNKYILMLSSMLFSLTLNKISIIHKIKKLVSFGNQKLTQENCYHSIT